MSKLKVYYCNARSIRNKIGPEFQEILQNFDLILITESWLRSSDIFQFNDFITLRCDRADDSGHGGSLILIKKSLNFVQFPCKSYKTIEPVFIDLKNNCGKKTRLGVVYNRPNCSQESFEELANLIPKYFQ